MGEDVESVMGGVRMGVNVDIKRTDGEYRDIVRLNTVTRGDQQSLHIETENKGIVLLVLPFLSVTEAS